MTDENGEYLFENIPAGKNYITTAICPEEIDFKVKDVAEEVVEGAIYDAGISDAESTVLALCLEGLGEICLDSDILDLNDFRNHFKYEKVICEVCDKLAECLYAIPVWVCEITELCSSFVSTGGDDDDDDDPVTYNLTMLVNPTGGGATIPTVGGSPHNYPGGTVLPVSASPTTGWTFTGWSGNLSGSTNPTTILMNSNKSVTANFVEEDPCIINPPTADANGPYSDDAICGSPATIHLDGSGSSAGGTPIVSWEWSETALGALGSGETLDYDFDPGSYTVTLEVTDENNCTDTDTTTVTITVVCNDLNYLLVQGYNAESGCTGLQETHEEFTVVPNLINTGLWLYDKDHTPNVKNINFIARFDGASTLIEYRYRYRVQERDNPVFPDPEPWVGWSAWSNSGTSLGEDAYGYGFASDCMEAPSKPSNPSNYCYQFEIEIRVNGDLSTYTVHID